MDDESPETWMAASKRRGAIRLVVIGVIILAGGSIWGVRFWNHAVADSPITYVRVVTVLLLGIGAGLTGAGALALVRK